MPIDLVPLLAAGLLAAAPATEGNEGYMRAAYQAALDQENLLTACGGESDGRIADRQIELAQVASKLERLFGAAKVREWQLETSKPSSCPRAFRSSDTARELQSNIDELKRELEI